MDYLEKILVAFEMHSVEGIRECFNQGVTPNDTLNGKPLFHELINMYTRGPGFKQCVQAFVDYGLIFEDKPLLYVLLDDADSLAGYLEKDSAVLLKKYWFDCTFTPLYGVSLLHLCAEYNHLSCAMTLVDYGADVNARADCDEYGFGGQTPIFHTVNQNENKCMEVLQYLLYHKSDLSITVKGLIWGKGYPWETFIPSVNPLSYAMMGLLRQFQRTEKNIYEVVSLLLKARYGVAYDPPNIPNRYLLQ